MFASSPPKTLLLLAGTAMLGLSLCLSLPAKGQGSEPVLYPLPFGQPEVRFDGERDHASYQIYITAQMIRQGLAFQVAPTSAISIMPEASWMQTQINGHPLQPVRLGTDRATTVSQQIISPHMMQAGWNTVALSVDQRHRVDCTYPATFELWTDLDASSTGLVMMTGAQQASSPMLQGLERLLSMPLNNQGRARLHGILPEGASEEKLQALVDAMASLALALGTQAPQTSLSHAPIAGGINVRLDMAGQIAHGRYAISQIGQVPPDGVHAGGATELTLGGMTREHWASAAAQLSADLQPFQAQQTRVAHRVVDGADRFTLADLGLPSQEFAGRHFEQSFTLDLPVDYFSSDVGRAEIRLAGGYVEGLTDDAELSVQVNGKLAASIHLDGDQGEVFSGRSLYVDLGHFKPGRNEIAIVADVSHRDDQMCGMAALTNNTARFLLLDETEIVFPNFAQLGQVPRLAPGLGHALTGHHGVTRIHVPQPDVQTLSAAAALQVQLALDLGRADGVEISFGAPDEANSEQSANNDILIAALQDLPPQMARAVNLPVDELTLAWAPLNHLPPFIDAAPIFTASAGTSTNIRSVLPNQQPLPPALDTRSIDPSWTAWSDDPVEQRLSTLRQSLARQGQFAPDLSTTASITNATPLSVPSQRPPTVPGFARPDNGGDDLRQRWEQNVSDQLDVVQSAGELGQRLQNYVVGLMGEREHTPELSAQADLVIQQMASSPWSNGALTLITASEPARLQTAMETISQPRFWHTLGGSRAVFNQSEERLDVSSGLVEMRYVVTQPSSISNWRLVLAGYSSNNPLLYALVLLLLAPALGVVCGHAIHRSGQGQKSQPSTGNGAENV